MRSLRLDRQWILERFSVTLPFGHCCLRTHTTRQFFSNFWINNTVCCFVLALRPRSLHLKKPTVQIACSHSSSSIEYFLIPLLTVHQCPLLSGDSFSLVTKLQLGNAHVPEAPASKAWSHLEPPPAFIPHYRKEHRQRHGSGSAGILPARSGILPERLRRTGCKQNVKFA